MNALILIPTYNELENLRELIERIFLLKLDMKVLVIDDNSEDGTGKLADELAKDNDRIYVLHRSKKEGLGKAYLAGFKYAIENINAENIIQMDADLSHDPIHIPQFLEKIKKCDLVIGSRYYKGKISVVNWPLSRLIISYAGSKYIRIFTRLKISDPTTGFNCYRRDVIENILNHNIRSNGYAFLIELKYVCKKLGYRIEEIPIIFRDRSKGNTKMSIFKYIIEALLIIWVIKFRKFKGQN